jgi:hypothetical protein
MIANTAIYSVAPPTDTCQTFLQTLYWSDLMPVVVGRLLRR